MRPIDLVHGELTCHFQQKHGITVADFLERMLLDANNGIFSDSSDMPENLKLYAKDINFLAISYSSGCFQICSRRTMRKILQSKFAMSPNLAPYVNYESCEQWQEYVEGSFQVTQDCSYHFSYYSNSRTNFCILCHLKTFLHSTTSQPRLNHCMLLHAHKPEN